MHHHRSAIKGVIRAIAVLLIGFVFCVSSLGCGTPQKEIKKTEPVASPKKDIVKSCAVAIRQFQNREQTKQFAVQTCASMWRKPKCQDAWTSTNEDLTNHILRSCAQAYCDEDLKSALCEIPVDEIDIFSDTHSWFTLWRSFNHEILRTDLQMTETGAVGDVAVALLLAVSQPGLNEPWEAKLQIRATWQNGRWFLDVMPRNETTETRHFQIPIPNRLNDFDDLKNYLKLHFTGMQESLVTASRPLDPVTKTHLLLTLRGVGVGVITFE